MPTKKAAHPGASYSVSASSLGALHKPHSSIKENGGVQAVPPFLALIVGLMLPLSGRSESISGTLYYLKDEGHGQWCGYRSLTEWKEQVQLRGAFVVGGIDLKQNHVWTVHVTTADETGDWSVNDEYSLDDKEKIRNLKRTISIIPEDLKQELVFAIKDGNTTKQGSVLRSYERVRSPLADAQSIG